MKNNNPNIISNCMLPRMAAMVLCAMLWFTATAQLKFTGSSEKIISEKADANTGLEQLYVIYNTQGVKASYTSSTGSTVTWSRYSNLGGGYAEEIPTVQSGNTYTIDLESSDIGYIIDDGNRRYCYWVVNYANHYADFQRLDIAEEQECDRARLTFTGVANKITYYTINGAARELNRGIQLEYYTLKYDEATESYNQIRATQTLSSIDQTIGIFAPLCDTRITMSGDKFLKEWGMEQSIETTTYKAIAVEAQTSAVQELRDYDNEQKVEANLGGSGPVTITFKAAVTDAAIFREWQMSHEPTFETLDDRFQQLEFEYTFRENGNTFVRFIANNAAGTCEFEGETYEVFIGESNLLCPNVFSPNDDGVNDEWKVSYRSIIEFECHIFNRWGVEVMSSTDPSQGWDGKYNGKEVPTGVYYYVIKAKGSDGRKYKLNGDINIIKSKGHKDSGSTSD